MKRDPECAVITRTASHAREKDAPMKLEILQFPHPTLSVVCTPVVEITEEIRQLAADMLETMKDLGGIGLAAPQVGQPINLIVLAKCPIDLVMINPEIIDVSGRETGWPERCLSCPDQVVVKRPKWCWARWTDLDGELHTRRFSHLDARCVQHEIDHLEGKTIADG
jgi:peptide deformylase